MKPTSPHHEIRSSNPSSAVNESEARSIINLGIWYSLNTVKLISPTAFKVVSYYMNNEKMEFSVSMQKSMQVGERT